MRIHDPRLGRFLSVDPLTKDYPWYTPYQFAGNMPIVAIDLDGAEPLISPKTYGEMKDPMLSVKGAGEIITEKGWGFLAGIGNTALGLLGVATQVPAAGHYGNKVPKSQWAQQFPAIPNNHIGKDLVVPMVMAPADLLNRIKSDPFDTEAWGEVAAIIGISSVIPKAKGRAPDISLGLNEPVPGGGPRSLYRFAEETQSYMHNNWETPFGSIAKPTANMKSFGEIFINVMDHVTSNGGTVKFDLTNFKMSRAVSDIGKSSIDASSMTSFEFNTIMSNKKYFKSTQFYENGKALNPKIVTERYQKAIEQSKQNR
jgi:hypothetical protein